MTSPKRYDRIAFVASAGTEAQAALAQLTELYGNHDADDADVVVALGGDGLMLQTLHAPHALGQADLRHASRHRRLPDERILDA